MTPRVTSGEGRAQEAIVWWRSVVVLKTLNVHMKSVSQQTIIL